MHLTFDNTYIALPDHFYSRVDPEPVSKPETIKANHRLARQLGFDPEWLQSKEGAEFIVGNRILEGSEPIAMVYAGHQFGNWVPRLGDGRALLLGEVVDPDGQRFDLHLKGSGRTPYSRGGDGRAPLGPVLREYLLAEAMHTLGVPTSRALAAARTGDPVYRDGRLPGAVLVRVAKSHIRIGTFEYFAARGDAEAIHRLVSYTIERHYPGLPQSSPIELLRAFSGRLAGLVARWQLLGFIHGVMNTDNMLLSGETIDYGPCAFMNEYDSETVFSSIDRYGRYAYGNQPAIARWNLSRLAQALVITTGTPDDESTDEQEHFLQQAQALIDEFPETFRSAYLQGMARKLGLGDYRDDYLPLIEDLLEVMAETRSDYTITFRGLMTELGPGNESLEAQDELFSLDPAFDPWLTRWQAHLDECPLNTQESYDLMSRQNPVFIPRNYLVEEALQQALDNDETAFHKLHEVLKAPFTYRAEDHRFALPPAPEKRVQATFCGT